MALPASVREAHIDEAMKLPVEAKHLLNRLLDVASGDTLSLYARFALDEEVTAMWEQLVDISTKNRAGIDRVTEELEADGKETPAAIDAISAA
jgi:hypothetical protein